MNSNHVKVGEISYELKVPEELAFLFRAHFPSGQDLDNYDYELATLEQLHHVEFQIDFLRETFDQHRKNGGDISMSDP